MRGGRGQRGRRPPDAGERPSPHPSAQRLRQQLGTEADPQDGILLPAEKIPGEKLKHGDRIKAYVVGVNKGDKRVQVNLSRTHPELVRGLFARSRNPIFLGMRVSLLGFFFLLPNAVTLLTLVLGEVLVQLQVRLEEDFLTKAQGDAYRAYCRRVRRWL